MVKKNIKKLAKTPYNIRCQAVFSKEEEHGPFICPYSAMHEFLFPEGVRYFCSHHYRGPFLPYTTARQWTHNISHRGEHCIWHEGDWYFEYDELRAYDEQLKREDPDEYYRQKKEAVLDEAYDEHLQKTAPEEWKKVLKERAKERTLNALETVLVRMRHFYSEAEIRTLCYETLEALSLLPVEPMEEENEEGSPFGLFFL